MATTDEHRTIAPIVGPDDPRRFTDSGIEVKARYTEEDLPENLSQRLGEPGEYPYTRGVHADMYRRQLWTMRQYAGYASAKESNERYRYLLEHGSTGLSMAFDLPTQLGLDSDNPRWLGEVGRTGVAIDTIDDMRTAFDGIPLDQVSTSMTINAPAAVLLLLYDLVAEEQGVPSEQLRGTTQNDILKEYIARGNFIYPPEGAIRLTTDLFAYCNEHVPKWNTISISGYHFREKGCSAVQEVAFTLANGIAYVQAALDAGLEIDRFAPRLAFFFNGHNNVFQEVAKFRAARRMWAEIMRERFGAKDERSWRLRFHTQTGGVTLTAQQPENNIVRVALQGFAAVCGGTQSLHTNGFDEALALPTERAARIALRTQQILGYESGAADTVDPFAGSYFVEALTDEIEASASELIAKVDELGGSVKAIDFMKNEIEESAFGYHERYRIGQDMVVGVNKFEDDRNPEVPDILRVDPAIDTIDDMRTAFDEIPLDQVSTSMTINAPAAVLLLLYELVGEEQGVPSEQLRGTTQNDILKEYIARGNFIYPPEGAIRLTTDLFAYCNEHIPKWNTISISGYHFREKGCSAVQEVAFTLANGIAYVQAALDAGLEVDHFAPAAGVLLQRPQQRLPGGREVPRRPADVGRDHARALRRQGRALLAAALPHPDRRRHADRPAAREQHRPRRAAGLRRRLRRHPVAAHQRLRRGAGAAHRARRQDRAAHPADHRLRVGRGRHRRPVRRLVLRRGADRRDRDQRARADRQDRRARRLGPGDRLHEERDRGVGVRLPRALPDRAGHRRRRQQVRRGRRPRCPTSCASTPSPSASRSSA